MRKSVSQTCWTAKPDAGVALTEVVGRFVGHTTGTVTLTTYSPDGQQTDRTQQAFATTFSLRNTTSDRWLTTDTPAAAKAD